MSKLPLRLRILQEISKTPTGHNIQSVMEALKGEYGEERQFNEPAFLDHLLSLKESGLLDENKIFLDADKKLLVNYIINANGKEALRKYLPKK